MSGVGTVLARWTALGSCPGMDPRRGSRSSDLKAEALGKCGDQVTAPYQTLGEIIDMALTSPERASPARLPRDPTACVHTGTPSQSLARPGRLVFQVAPWACSETV